MRVRREAKAVGHHTALMILGLTFGLLLVACGTASKVSSNHAIQARSGAATGPTSAPVDPQNPNASIDEVPFASINHLVNTSDAAVVGVVTAVSPPKWNSPSGQAWTFSATNTDSYRPIPLIYRDVTVTVSQVLFSDTNLSVQVGDTLTILVSGNGTNTGATIDGQNGLRWNLVDGTFTANTQELLLLKESEYPFSDAQHSVTMLTQSRNSHWQILGATAASDVPGRSVDASGLMQRIVSERAKGFQPEGPNQGDNTAINPLG